MIAQKIAEIFKTIDEVWEVIPGYVKVFVYSTLSSIIGLYYTGSLDKDAVIAILLVNLGLYSAPKGMNQVSGFLRKK